jgi:hypothetical protein
VCVLPAGVDDDMTTDKVDNKQTVSLASLFEVSLALLFKAERERDDLRAENERLRAEVERMTFEAMRWADENNRLRDETGRA